eukprot:COSAG04_NODE_631_length_11736_cov_11.237690_7_plen_157_part_00
MVGGRPGDPYLLFHTNDNKPHPDIATCTGVPGSAPFRGTLSPCVGCPSTGGIGVASAKSPAGPWTTTFPFLGQEFARFSSPANPSPLVMANGSLMVAVRYSQGLRHKAGEAITVLAADHLQGPWQVSRPTIRGSRQAFAEPSAFGFRSILHKPDLS